MLGYLFAQAEDPTYGLAETYLLSPAWQQAVPEVTTLRGWRTLCDWVAGRYPLETAAWIERARACDEEELAASVFDRTSPPNPLSEAERGRRSRGVNLLGHFRYESGLQTEIEQNAAALFAAGYGIARRDAPIAAPREWRTGPRGLDLELHSVSLLKLGAQERVDEAYHRAGLHPRSGVYRIACWSWELEAFPSDAVAHAGLIDEVWAPTAFCAAAVRQVVTDRPVLVMPPAVPDPEWTLVPRARFGLPDDRFLFLFAFDLASVMERKNPLGLIEAFRLAFRADDRVHLAIKVTRGDQYPADLARLRAAAGPRVSLIDAQLPRPEALGLMAACDAYVSLHRSEGVGLTMAEAMLLGKPTIATGYSGNLDFMTAENSRLVDHRRVALDRDYPPYPRGAVWAEPDVRHAAALLRAVQRPDEARAVGERGRDDVRRLLNPAMAGQRMAERLGEILARTGRP